MSGSAWASFEKENNELLQRWCNEEEEAKKAKLWNEIIDLWGDWKETRK
jgi:hypothetical protein